MAEHKPLVLINGRPSLLPNGDLPIGGLPSGGTTGQVLTKASATDGDANWQTPSGGGGFNPVLAWAY